MQIQILTLRIRTLLTKIITVSKKSCPFLISASLYKTEQDFVEIHYTVYYFSKSKYHHYFYTQRNHNCITKKTFMVQLKIYCVLVLDIFSPFLKTPRSLFPSHSVHPQIGPIFFCKKRLLQPPPLPLIHLNFCQLYIFSIGLPDSSFSRPVIH